LSILSQR